MNDCALGRHQNEGDDICARCGEDLNPPLMPYTVLLMLPDYIRCDQSHAANEVTRIHCQASDPVSAVTVAINLLPGEVNADLDDLDDYAPVAVFQDHIVDQYDPEA